MMSFKIKASKEFKKKYRDITRKGKDKALKEKIDKSIDKLKDHPYAGKPLKHNLAGLRSLRVGKYRINGR
jgi:mRNA-degrading endonuclease RelE of RelBE toxin-antitoxin system